MCVSLDEAGLVDKGLGRCKSIETLKIDGTKVTTKGIQMALENLTKLKVFAFSVHTEEHQSSGKTDHETLSSYI